MNDTGTTQDQGHKLLAAMSRAKARMRKEYRASACEFVLTTDGDPPLDVFVMVTQNGGPKGQAVSLGVG